jgi:small subunit ribosomal protein S20
MANHASAEKRNRQRITRTERNRAAKSALRTDLKKTRAAIGGDDATAKVQSVQSKLDKAAKRGVIPTKRASRLKSRLAKAAHKAANAKSE